VEQESCGKNERQTRDHRLDWLRRETSIANRGGQRDTTGACEREGDETRARSAEVIVNVPKAIRPCRAGQIIAAARCQDATS
jgi:hypothetical protein